MVATSIEKLAFPMNCKKIKCEMITLSISFNVFAGKFWCLGDLRPKKGALPQSQVSLQE